MMASARVYIDVDIAPPPVRVEVVPVARVGYVWAPGYWYWSGHQHVWVGGGDEPAWLRGGTYLVARRIRMLIEVWDRASLGDQQQTIGRIKASGSPLGRSHEFDPVDAFAAFGLNREKSDLPAAQSVGEL